MFTRKVSRLPMAYNLSLFQDPPPIALDLLEVRYVVSGPPYVGSPSRLVTRPGHLGLYEISEAPVRASVVGVWRVVRDSDEALRVVTEKQFDPSRHVVLEQGADVPEPPVTGPPAGQTADARYTGIGPQEAVIRIVTEVPSVLVVRIPYDRHWKATIDDRPAPVMPADFAIQAVPVPAGSHTVRLTYDDPSIGIGLAGTVISLLALVTIVAVVRTRERDE